MRCGSWRGASLPHRIAHALEWVTSLGGPLIAVPVSLIDAWGGADPPSDGRAIQVTRQFDPSLPATDYDRACEAAGLVGTIEIAGGQGLVLSSDTQSATWRPRLDGGGVFVCPFGIDDAVQVVEIAEQMPTREFGSADLDWVVVSDQVRLFDSSMPGRDIATPFQTFVLPHGRYHVHTARIDKPSIGLALVHRVTPVPAKRR